MRQATTTFTANEIERPNILIGRAYIEAPNSCGAGKETNNLAEPTGSSEGEGV